MNAPFYLFAGGGTGGHLAPGIAVASELRVRHPDCRIEFCTSDRAIERQMLAKTGFDLSSTPAVSLNDFKKHPFRSALSLLKSLKFARERLHRDPPTAVIGLGGFASFPLVREARQSGLPVILLEQNVYPGRVTRLCARHSHVCVSFNQTSHWLSSKATVHVTGNPLRRELLHISSGTNPPVRPTLLVLGGSQGSRQINQSVLAAVRDMSNELKDWNILHQTGSDETDVVQKVYSQLGLASTAVPFVDEIGLWYQQATLAIARAGATTLSELALFGIPAILIPHPQSADDHQTLNAIHYENCGAASVCSPPRRTMSPVKMTETLRMLISNREQRSSMRTAMLASAQPDATSLVCNVIESVSTARSAD